MGLCRGFDLDDDDEVVSDLDLDLDLVFGLDFFNNNI